MRAYLRELSISLTESGKQYAEQLLSDLYEIEKRVFDTLTKYDVIEELETICNELYRKEKVLRTE